MIARKASLRRYELAHGRGAARSLDALQKHRRDLPTGSIEIVPDRRIALEFRHFGTRPHAMTEEKRRTKPPSTCENVTNEPTVACDVGRNGPTYVKTPENSTNEATDHCENVTNEPTDACEIVTNVSTLAVDVRPDGPTYVKTPAQNSTNEASGDRENVTNEAIDASQEEGQDLNGSRSRIKITSRIMNEDRRPTADGEIRPRTKPPMPTIRGERSH